MEICTICEMLGCVCEMDPAYAHDYDAEGHASRQSALVTLEMLDSLAEFDELESA